METLMERALGVTSGLRKVTPDAGGLESRGSRVGGARAVGGPGLGTLRRVRDWERARPGGRGEPSPPRDRLLESATSLGSVSGAAAGWMARSGVSLGRGDWLPLGVGGGVQRSAWSFTVFPFAVHGASQLLPSHRRPKSDSSQ